jgi:hypothetical protein
MSAIVELAPIARAAPACFALNNPADLGVLGPALRVAAGGALSRVSGVPLGCACAG